ncbi:MAG: hypothetical protein IPP71_18400 [Bacteroidetes bacterium]|nr:hypothetical protein [Bacteroidota bacterium]
MDLNGNYVWVDRIITSGEDVSRIFISPFGKIYLITQTEGSSQFGNFNLPPGGGIIQYDAAGNCLSAEILFTPSAATQFNEVYMKFIESDIFFHGYFNTTSFQLDTFNLTNLGTSDAFLAGPILMEMLNG